MDGATTHMQAGTGPKAVQHYTAAECSATFAAGEPTPHTPQWPHGVPTPMQQARPHDSLHVLVRLPCNDVGLVLPRVQLQALAVAAEAGVVEGVGKGVHERVKLVPALRVAPTARKCARIAYLTAVGQTGRIARLPNFGQSGNRAVRQPDNWAVGQSGSRAVGQSGSRAVGLQCPHR